MQAEGAAPRDIRRNHPEDLDCEQVIPAYEIQNNNFDKRGRNKMPLWHQLSFGETLILRDQMLSPHTIDAVTIFSLRPPELRFIRKIALYFKWFYRQPQINTDLRRAKNVQDQIEFFESSIDPNNVSVTPWIDGTGCQIYIRPSALPLVLEYLEQRTDGDFYGYRQREDYEERNSRAIGQESPKYQMTRLFKKLERYNTSLPDKEVSRRRYLEAVQMMKDFITPANYANINQNPVVWYNLIKPINHIYVLFTF